MRKVCVVLSARPSYSRIKSALEAINNHKGLELQLVLTASSLLDKYGEVIKNVKADNYKVSAEVFTLIEGETLLTSAKTTGLGIIEIANVFNQLQPDIVVTIADRYETLATAVAASYMNIPLAHVQGGEITGSIDEKVRNAVTRLSDIHLVATNKAAERLERMGEDPDTIFTTSCPSIDIASSVERKEELEYDIVSKYGGVGGDLDLSLGYLVVLQHPVTTEWEDAQEQVTKTLRAIKDLNYNAIWLWPNSDAGSDGISKGIRIFREFEQADRIRYFTHFPPEDFIRILHHSRGIVGNSSVGIRECSFLGIPTVNIGSRQRGRERGKNVIDVGYDYDEIKKAVIKQWGNGHYDSDELYGSGGAGEKIAAILADIELSIEKSLSY
jgi:UDP-hydrolysing UDP-N-acetyl-D-glucosamine 2-epimerase